MITGSLVALITPMKPKSFDVDWHCFEKLIKWHIFNKTNAIVVVGTTGESSTLSFSEHKKVIERALEYAAGEIPIIAGTGANSTSEAIELTRSAADAGADACLLVTPYYNKPSQNGLFEHYKLIANTVDVDQILYNVPSRTACSMAWFGSISFASGGPVTVSCSCPAHACAPVFTSISRCRTVS